MQRETTDHLERCVYTTSRLDERGYRCVIVLNKDYAVTYQHGTEHSRLAQGQKLTIFNVLEHSLRFEVTIETVSPRNDFIILKNIDGGFPVFPTTFNTMYIGQKYFQLGINKKSLFWKDGVISKMEAGFFLGTSYGQAGDSGSGIFDLNGRFIGMSSAKLRFEFSRSQFSGASIDLTDLADHHSETKIISADALMTYMTIDDDDLMPPGEKKFSAEEK